MFRVFEITPQDVDRFPAAGAHDGGRVVAHGQEILGGADPHGMPAEGADIVALEACGCRGRLDQAFDGCGAEIPVDRLAVVDGAEEPRDSRGRASPATPPRAPRSTREVKAMRPSP
jgi:hypothetical protein